MYGVSIIKDQISFEHALHRLQNRSHARGQCTHPFLARTERGSLGLVTKNALLIIAQMF